jgi:hypothetical protein
MYTRIRKSKWTEIFVCLGVFGLLIWLVLSPSLRATVYQSFNFGGAYERYDRLADKLRLGMSSDEVRRTLGRPESQEALQRGQRWTYCDDGPTAGWLCVVDFSSEADSLRLAYFFNIQHTAFTNSLHREFGSPVDGGEFKSYPMLKKRRNQWYGISTGQ